MPEGHLTWTAAVSGARAGIETGDRPSGGSGGQGGGITGGGRGRSPRGAGRRCHRQAVRGRRSRSVERRPLERSGGRSPAALHGRLRSLRARAGPLRREPWGERRSQADRRQVQSRDRARASDAARPCRGRVASRPEPGAGPTLGRRGSTAHRRAGPPGEPVGLEPCAGHRENAGRGREDWPDSRDRGGFGAELPRVSGGRSPAFLAGGAKREPRDGGRLAMDAGAIDRQRARRHRR